jgi:hypothetical protein
VLRSIFIRYSGDDGWNHESLGLLMEHVAPRGAQLA